MIDDDRDDAPQDHEDQSRDDHVRDKDIDPDDGIRRLRDQYENEKRSKEQAEQRAIKAEIDLQKSNSITMQAAILRSTDLLDSVKKQYSQALASGDTDAAADLQLKMSEIIIDKQRLESAQHQPQNAPTDVAAIVKQLAEGGNYLAADWISKNPSFGTGQNLENAKRYSKEILDMGIAANDPAHYYELEKRLGMRDRRDQDRYRDADDRKREDRYRDDRRDDYRERDRYKDDDRSPRSDRRDERYDDRDDRDRDRTRDRDRSPPPSAPVSRSNTSYSRRSLKNADGMRLTPQEIEFSEICGFDDPKKYADALLESAAQDDNDMDSNKQRAWENFFKHRGNNTWRR